MKSKQLLMASSVLLAPHIAFGGSPLDMSGPVICAVTEIVGCEMSGDCVRSKAETFNLPVLLRVDIANKVAESARSGDEKRVSVITGATDVDGVSVLHGVDGIVGWSATIDRVSGEMIVVSAHPNISYTAFGTCATL
jgi:hypothetical protein